MTVSGQTPALKGVDIIRQTASRLSTSAGVYRMLDEKGAVLYIGKARNLKNRVSHYINITQLPIRLQRMVHSTHSVEIVITASEVEALLLESSLIKHYQPRYNILLKDDKSYPYIHISGNHAYPRICKYRGAQTEAGEYLGPFISATAVNETLAFLQRAFLLRPCSDKYFKSRARPCLQYQIKRCSAPCVGLVSEHEYAQLLRQAKDCLSGKNNAVKQEIVDEMRAASQAMEFEKAALLRDRIRALTHVQQHAQSVAALGDTDIIALARDGKWVCIQVFVFRAGRNYGNQVYFPHNAEGKTEAEIMEAFLGQHYSLREPPEHIFLSHAPTERALLEEALRIRAGHKVELLTPQRGERRRALEHAIRNAKEALSRHIAQSSAQIELLEGVARIFNLSNPPKRIEVYDNSHVMGTQAVGGMIVAQEEGFIKSAYRKFGIKNTALTPGDDYGMMREVLTRRFQRLQTDDKESSNRPDLVLLDGGPGQLSVAMEVWKDLQITDVALVAISKGPDRNAGREWFHLPHQAPFQLPKDDAVLHYLQRLRDEAHRFAISFHRDKRSKQIRRSELDDIAAIGAKRKRALLNHFGSVRAIAGASLEELGQAEGISKELAQKIYAHFH